MEMKKEIIIEIAPENLQLGDVLAKSIGIYDNLGEETVLDRARIEQIKLLGIKSA